MCDNQGPILVLFDVIEGNNKVGIYSSLSFDISDKWKEDKETFIFSLNQNRKYKNIRNKYYLYCNSNIGPYTDYFGIKKDMKILYLGAESINLTYENGDEILPSEKDKNYELFETEVFRLIIEK